MLLRKGLLMGCNRSESGKLKRLFMAEQWIVTRWVVFTCQWSNVYDLYTFPYICCTSWRHGTTLLRHTNRSHCNAGFVTHFGTKTSASGIAARENVYWVQIFQGKSNCLLEQKVKGVGSGSEVKRGRKRMKRRGKSGVHKKCQKKIRLSSSPGFFLSSF